MEQRETQRSVLRRLVDGGRLTEAEADEIRTAPEWSVTVRELFTYLAGLIIFTGFVRIVGMALHDASENTIASVLLVVGVILAIVARRMPHSRDWQSRLAEVAETGSIATLCAAAGLWLSLTELSGQTIVFVIAVPLVAWGWWRSRCARFVGSLALSAGVPMLTMAVAAMFNEDSSFTMGLASLVAGAVLVVIGQRDVHTAFVQRAVGCYFALMGSFMSMAEGGNAGKVIPIAIGAVLFWVGSLHIQPESLVAGAIAITVGMTVAMGDWLPSEFTRGLTTMGVGVAMLLATMGQLRRRGDDAVSPPEPGTPSA